MPNRQTTMMAARPALMRDILLCPHCGALRWIRGGESFANGTERLTLCCTNCDRPGTVITAFGLDGGVVLKH